MSAVAHVFLTPVAAWLGLLAWMLNTSPPADEEVEQLTAIPISLFEDPGTPSETEPDPAAQPAPPAGDLPVPAKPAPKVEAPAPPVPKPAPSPPRELPAKATDKAGIDNPVQVSGIQSKVIDSNANVSLLLLSERIRSHRLGERIGRLLVEFPQWQSFLETTRLDPINDLERILVVGPQFRRSAEVVVVVQYRIETALMRAAIDRLVQREPKGRWLGSKPAAARAHADRAERLFVFSGPQILVIAPPQLERQLLGVSIIRFPDPRNDEALVANIKTPWRALMGLPVSLPKSLAWARLGATPLADGGAQLRIEAEDADAALAAQNALALSRNINALTNPELGPLGALLGVRSLSFLDRIDLRAQGRRISGQIHINAAQLERLLRYSEQFVRQWSGRSSASGTPGSSPPSAGSSQPSVTRAPLGTGAGGSSSASPAGSLPRALPDSESRR